MQFQGKQVNHNGGAISTGTHITVTCDSDTYTYYVNGVDTQYTTSGTSTFGTSGYVPTDNTADFDFFHNDQSSKFSGKVKDFRMYDRVLTQSEIDELVAMGLAGGGLSHTYSFTKQRLRLRGTTSGPLHKVPAVASPPVQN